MGSLIPYKKDGLLFEDNWEKRRGMAEQQVLTKWCLSWGLSRSKTHIQKKNEIKHPGRICLPTKCGRAAKSLLVDRALPFSMEICLLGPIHFVSFLQNPAVHSYNKKGSDPSGWISKGILLLLYMHMCLYITCTYILIHLFIHSFMNLWFFFTHANAHMYKYVCIYIYIYTHL